MKHKLKNSKLIDLKRIAAIVTLVFLVAFSLSQPLQSQSITQSYPTDYELRRGMIVVLDTQPDTESQKVLPAELQNEEDLHGVVVDRGASAITLSSDNDQVLVATQGTHEVLVSSENGPIQPGNHIAVSSYSGIGTKAGNEQQFVIGKAVSGSTGATRLSGEESGEQNYQIWRLPVIIQVANNPHYDAKDEEQTVPKFLRVSSEAIAQKPVSPPRIYLSFAILLLAAGVAGSMLYAGIKNSVVAVGRNPLSQHYIALTLLKIILTSVIVFLIGIFGVYLILRT